jgi:hypothetical protein
MRSMIIAFLFAFLAVSVFGANLRQTATQCDPAKKSAFCPMIYSPVCGQLAGDEVVFKTFSNSCMACNGGAVLYYQGACQATA